MNEAEDPELFGKIHNSSRGAHSSEPIILAMGVGGGGGNAINYMCNQGVKGVEFIVLNTDEQALRESPVPNRLLLGPKICNGRGAGGRPEIGRAAGEESVPEIEALLDGMVDMVFVTAGMGGGTGTGAAPVVARVAKGKNILTVGIVTIPFFFEGTKKISSALDGAHELQQNVDAMLVINNDRLSAIYPDMEWALAFEKADDILATAARSISDMVTTPGMINIDMRDVDSTLRNGRTALISVGYGEGENRMSTAISGALHSPLLCDTDILSARSLLFAFYYSHDIDPPYKVSESSEINRLIAEMNKRVEVIFGWGYDDTLGNKIKFTILASGFDVSLQSAGSNESHGVIEGVAETTGSSSTIDNRIIDAYGKDKVDDLIRIQETQNYYILKPDQLDSDDAIDMVERNPAFKRDKRKLAAAKTEPETRHQDERSQNNSNQITFSPDDR